MAAFRSTCLLFCATVLCGLVASTRVETDLAAEEAAGAVAPSLALVGSVVEPVDRMVRSADPNPGKNKKQKNGKGKGKKAKKGEQSKKRKASNRRRKVKRKGKGKKTNKSGQGKTRKANNKQKKVKGKQKNTKKNGQDKKRKPNKVINAKSLNKVNKNKNKPKNNRRKTRKTIRKKKKNSQNSGRGRKAKVEMKKGKKNTDNSNSRKLSTKKLNKKKSRKTLRKPEGGKKQSGRQTRNSTVALSCLTTAIRLLKFQKDNVNNFLTRHTRQLRQNALTTKKSGKKGEFAEPSARLVQAGGGDLQNLSCSGSTTNAGAKNLKNITTRLGACQKGIQDACKPPAGINQTFMEQCYNKSMGFNKTLVGCVKTALTGVDPCSCFMDAKLVFALTDLKSCKGDSEAKLAAKTRNACLKKVRECKADVATAGTLQYSCKITTDEMLKTLAQILNNNSTVAAMMAKVKALTGVKSAKPKTIIRNVREADQAQEIPDYIARHAGNRIRRQATTAKATTAGATKAGATTDGATTAGATTAGATTAGASTAGASTAGATTAGATAGSTTAGASTAGSTTGGATTTAAPTCGGITTVLSSCSSAITNTPADGLAISTVCAITTTTTVACTTAEKVALQAASDSVNVATRIFMAFKISLESELKESSGTTPTPAVLNAAVAALPANAGATAAAAGRNRNILRKMIMDRLRK